MAKIKSTGKGSEQLNLSYIAGGNITWYSHSGNSLTNSYKIKYMCIISSSNRILGYLFYCTEWCHNQMSHLTKGPEYFFSKNEIFCSHKALYTNVHRSFICNSQKLKTSQINTNEWIEIKLETIYTMKYYAKIKMKELSIHASIWMNVQGIVLSLKSQS